MTGYNEKRHGWLASRAKALVEGGKTVDEIARISDEVAARAGKAGSEISADKIEKLIAKDYGPHGTRLRILELTLAVAEDPLRLENIKSDARIADSSNIRWFDVRVREHNKVMLAEVYEKIKGHYSCFYRSREKEKNGREYIERVRYEISGFPKSSHFQGAYTTEFSSGITGQRKSFLMLMKKGINDVISVVHFPGRQGRTISYSLVRIVSISDEQRPVMYGIAIREGHHATTMVAIKTIWFPEEREDHLGDKYIFYKDDVDAECWEFLETFFEPTREPAQSMHTTPRPDRFFLEFDGDHVTNALIVSYAKKCGDRPLMRLRSSPSAVNGGTSAGVR